MTAAHAPTPPTLTSRLTHRLGERRKYAGLSSWICTFYDTLLIRPRMRWLPGYRSVCGLRLAQFAGKGGGERPLYVRLGTTDLSVLREIFFFGEYDVLKNVDASAVRTILDLGSNVGLSVRLWQEWFPGARIVGVEPDAENLRIAAMNAGEAATDGRVSLVRACAVGRGRMVGLDRRGGEWGFAMSEGAGGEQIEGLTVQEILARAEIGPETAIDLLKCDIEGAEAELFDHAGGWLGRVRTLIVELHGEYTPERFMAAARAAGGDFDWAVTQKAAALWVVFGRRRSGGS